MSKNKIIKILPDEFAWRSPESWVRRAHALREAARRLWDLILADPDRGWALMAMFQPISLMLAGLALEVLFKGRYVLERGAKPPKTHDLVRLAGEIGLSISDEEKSLLKGLSQWVEWLGRYPMPPERKMKEPIMFGRKPWWVGIDQVYERVMKLPGWGLPEWCHDVMVNRWFSERCGASMMLIDQQKHRCYKRQGHDESVHACVCSREWKDQGA